jgi:SAM-dependent methyltransferase
MHTYEIDWAEHAARLADAADQDREWYARTAAMLVRSGDRVAVDVGCGGGGMVAALAAALGSGGLAVGADVSAELLAAAAAARRDVPGRIEWVVADLDAGVEPLRVATGGSADVVWASASVHHLADQQAGVTALAGLLGAGGRLALAEGGLPARHLPWDLGVGEPGLEVRLDAAQDRWFARMRAGLPGSVPMPYGWSEALRLAGLTEVRAVSALLERPVPLSADDLRRVVEGLTYRVDQLRPTGLLDAGDLAAWDRILDPAADAFLGRRGDLQSLQARTVHIGARPA